MKEQVYVFWMKMYALLLCSDNFLMFMTFLICCTLLPMELNKHRENYLAMLNPVLIELRIVLVQKSIGQDYQIKVPNFQFD